MLRRDDDRSKALARDDGGAACMDEPRRRFAARCPLSSTIRYDLGEGHPLLGPRMPDLDVEADDGPRRGL